MALAHVRDAPRPLPPDIPPAVAALVMQMLVKDPAARFPNGAALAQAVGRSAGRAAVRPARPATPAPARTRAVPRSAAGQDATRPVTSTRRPVTRAQPPQSAAIPRPTGRPVNGPGTATRNRPVQQRTGRRADPGCQPARRCRPAHRALRAAGRHGADPGRAGAAAGQSGGRRDVGRCGLDLRAGNPGDRSVVNPRFTGWSGACRMIITGNARAISINPRRDATRRPRSASFVEAICASRPDAPARGSGPLGIGSGTDGSTRQWQP